MVKTDRNTTARSGNPRSSRNLRGTDWVLITGQPHCGKTIAIQTLVRALQKSGVRCRGFITEEVLKGRDRNGFDVLTVPDGKRAILSRKEGLSPSLPKTGKYTVDVKSFESVALASLSPNKSDPTDVVYIVDEIGRMELHSIRFQERIRNLLSQGVRLLGVVTAPGYGHRVPFCDELCSKEGVKVHKLTKACREPKTISLMEELLTKWSPHGGSITNGIAGDSDSQMKQQQQSKDTKENGTSQTANVSGQTPPTSASEAKLDSQSKLQHQHQQPNETKGIGTTQESEQSPPTNGQKENPAAAVRTEKQAPTPTANLKAAKMEAN
eukprot:CAMPEP_0195286514 /NCGR_PEP_ID=MMETSP0707-20130614/3944_1 /TAXON_ID=33640 /ORGANISM="Asterionellopsis glacialis, Strain CCMP134" /LENGTH=323 /DNA_ID=CAMNT_0040346165 /DNA_START=53 /DNA_END=1024 /DNA_ORIENTATION=-